MSQTVRMTGIGTDVSMWWGVVRTAILWCGLVVVSACEEPVEPDPEPEPVQVPTAIVVTPDRADFSAIGDTARLVAVVVDQDGDEIPDAEVEWASANVAIATVTGAGLVTAAGAGNTNVTVRYRNLETQVPITVTVPTWPRALTVFYESTDGPNWIRNDNWLSNKAFRWWWGLGVDAQGRVNKIGIFKNGLNGNIPPELAELKRIGKLYLHDNDLTGNIPPTISRLTGLTSLTLDRNSRMEGLLPHELLELNLYEFGYEDTKLCAPRTEAFEDWLNGVRRLGFQLCVPTRHDRLVLTELYHALGGSNWVRRGGWLSEESLDQWAGVTVDAEGMVVGLDLAANGVVGDLPHELSYLSALTRLDLSGNPGLGGALEEWIRNLSLQSFDFSGTGLCVPPSEHYEGWLTSLGEWNGDVCAGADSILASIPVVYLTQATQNRQAEVPMIAGRDALLRVFPVADAENYFDSEVRATLYQDDQEVHSGTMALSGRLGIGVDIDESRLDRSYAARIPGEVLVPGVALVVELDPEGKLPLKEGSQRRVPETGALAVEIREMPVMELTIVPVKIAGKSDSAVVAAVRALTYDSPELKDFRTMIPVGEVDFSVREPITVKSREWNNRALEILEALRKADGAEGYYLGICDCRGGVAELGGKVSRSELDSYIMAHEIGHNLSLLHAPCGSPAGFLDDNYPYAGGRTGTWGYDTETGELRTPRVPDLMSYCEPPWIGDYGYLIAMEHRLSVENGVSGRSTRGDRRVPTLLLWGRAGPAEVTLRPATVLNAIPSIPDGGPYRVTGRAVGGETLFSVSFTPMVEAESGTEHFVITLPVDPAWLGSLASITLSGPGGSDTLDASSDRPLAVVTDRETGRIRRFLFDFAEPPEAGPDEEVTVSYGIPGARRQEGADGGLESGLSWVDDTSNLPGRAGDRRTIR